MNSCACACQLFLFLTSICIHLKCTRLEPFIPKPCHYRVGSRIYVKVTMSLNYTTILCSFSPLLSAFLCHESAMVIRLRRPATIKPRMFVIVYRQRNTSTLLHIPPIHEARKQGDRVEEGKRNHSSLNQPQQKKKKRRKQLRQGILQNKKQ